MEKEPAEQNVSLSLTKRYFLKTSIAAAFNLIRGPQSAHLGVIGTRWHSLSRPGPHPAGGPHRHQAGWAAAPPGRGALAPRAHCLPTRALRLGHTGV